MASLTGFSAVSAAALAAAFLHAFQAQHLESCLVMRLHAEGFLCSTASACIIQRYSWYLQELIEKTAKEIYDHQLQTRVVLGNPFSASIRDKCRDAVPEALTLLLVSEVGPFIGDTNVRHLGIDQLYSTAWLLCSIGHSEVLKAAGVQRTRVDVSLLELPFLL